MWPGKQCYIVSSFIITKRKLYDKAVACLDEVGSPPAVVRIWVPERWPHHSKSIQSYPPCSPALIKILLQ